MSGNRIDVTLIKLGAILVVILALGRLTDYAFYLPDGAPASLLAGGLILNFLVPVAIAWLLWRFPNLIAGTLAPFESDSGKPPLSADDVMLIGVALIGLYTLVFGVLDLMYFEGYRYAEHEIAKLANFPERPASPQDFAGRISKIAQIAFGIALLVGRRRIVELVRRARGIRPRPS